MVYSASTTSFALPECILGLTLLIGSKTSGSSIFEVDFGAGPVSGLTVLPVNVAGGLCTYGVIAFLTGPNLGVTAPPKDDCLMSIAALGFITEYDAGVMPRLKAGVAAPLATPL